MAWKLYPFVLCCSMVTVMTMVIIHAVLFEVSDVTKRCGAMIYCISFKIIWGFHVQRKSASHY